MDANAPNQERQHWVPLPYGETTQLVFLAQNEAVNAVAHQQGNNCQAAADQRSSIGSTGLRQNLGGVSRGSGSLDDLLLVRSSGGLVAGRGRAAGVVVGRRAAGGGIILLVVGLLLEDGRSTGQGQVAILRNVNGLGASLNDKLVSVAVLGLNVDGPASEDITVVSGDLLVRQGQLLGGNRQLNRLNLLVAQDLDLAVLAGVLDGEGEVVDLVEDGGSASLSQFAERMDADTCFMVFAPNLFRCFCMLSL